MSATNLKVYFYKPGIILKTVKLWRYIVNIFTQLDVGIATYIIPSADYNFGQNYYSNYESHWLNDTMTISDADNACKVYFSTNLEV